MLLRHCLAVLVSLGLVAVPATGLADTRDAPLAQITLSAPGISSTHSVPLPLSATPVIFTLSGTGLSGHGSVGGGADPQISADLNDTQILAGALAPFSCMSFNRWSSQPDGTYRFFRRWAGGGGQRFQSQRHCQPVVGLCKQHNRTVADQTITACVGNTSCGSALDSFSVDQTFDVYTNTALMVLMSVSVNGTGGTASAFVDPTITLGTDDPAYSLEFSPGLSSPIPEPSSLLLLTTGLLGGVGVIRRYTFSR